MKIQPLRKVFRLPFWVGLLLVFAVTSSLAGTVRLSPVQPGEQPAPAGKSDPDAPAWHRKLWDGSLDKASDAVGAAARNLENLDYGDCNDYLRQAPARKGEPQKVPDQNLYFACLQRRDASEHYAGQARSIQKQQTVMSALSKASDVAALGSVGAVIYGEVGLKQGDQSNSYQKAAKIQKIAGEVNYATGATDFAMGAYSYIAHKNKLEQMQRTLNGTVDGVKAETDPGVASSLSSAVEASKQAAYNHMLYGAGKMAAGYASVWLSKRSAAQAEKMRSIAELKEYNSILTNQAQPLVPTAPQQQAPVVIGTSAAPYYQNNQPSFAMPDEVLAAQAPATSPASGGPVTLAGSTGGSAILPVKGSLSRSPASGMSSRGEGRASGGGGGEGKAAEGEAPAKDAAVKEAMGNTFEMQLTGGVRAYTGSGHSEGGAPETPGLAALLGGSDNGGSAATGLSPSQVYQNALEGTDGTEQGSMAGVSGKRESSLFEITRAKLTKMLETGSIGLSKNVDVRN